MQSPRRGVWQNGAFVRLWTAETISVFGTQLSLLAIPLLAIHLLDATPLQLGILGAVEFMPFLFVGLVSGVLIDRWPRRLIMVSANVLRAALLLSIPLLLVLQQLRLELLYLIGFAVGSCTVTFNIAQLSLLPSVVEREELVQANSRLETSRSIASMAGPGLAGILIQAVSSLLALILGAVFYLVAALMVGQMRVMEGTSGSGRPPLRFWAELGAGVRMVWEQPALRAILGRSATYNLFFFVMRPVFVLYLSSGLGFEPFLLGVIIGCAGVGAFLGALVATRLTAHYGMGAMIIGAALVGGLGYLLIPLAGGPGWLVIAMMMLAQVLGGLSLTTYNINQVSLRQMLTPEHMQGRINATIHALVMGVIPIGSLLGGLLGELIGPRMTLAVGALGVLLSCLWLLFPPFRVADVPQRSAALR